MRLLLTRPEADAQRTAAALRALRHEVVIAPLLRIEAIADAAIGAGPWAAIAVTSANAASAIKAHGRFAELCGVPVFATGGRTAQVLREAGFADVASAEGNVRDLARLIAARMSPAALLYLAGEERSGDLAGDLQTSGFAVDTVAVYRAVAATDLPRAAAQALTQSVDGVLHFSRRSARAYIAAARNAGLLAAALKPVHFCLSAQIAEPLALAGAAATRIAPQPTEAALLDLIGAAT